MASPILLVDPLHPNNHNKTFPYGAACVGAYAVDVMDGAIAVEVARTCEATSAAVERRPPAVLGLSNYLWNRTLGYELACRTKHASPATVAVMGGPNYPDDADGRREFHRRHPAVDFYVEKEGEVPFAALIRCLHDAGYDASAVKNARVEIPGVHYVVDGELVAPSPTARARSLDAFPSPYLTGLLDGFFDDSGLVPLIQTKRGCPFQCTFCVEGVDYYTKLAAYGTERVRAELEYIARRVKQVPVLHIADSNFGMYEQDLEICDAIAETRRRCGWPETIEVSTGKNRKDRILEAVSRTDGAMRFGPALQSTDPQTLANVKRSNISTDELMDTARTAKGQGQRSYTELILNLPGDTVASHLESIRAAMEADIHRIKMYPLVLLPGTEMATRESRDRFGIQTRSRVMAQCHGEYRYLGEEFLCSEIVEMVIATDSMSFDDYVYCKRFELSVEIFYGDAYLDELHGLVRSLGVSMFDFVERCHAGVTSAGAELAALYDVLGAGLDRNLWADEAECTEHYADRDNMRRYAAREYEDSLGVLKAVALVEHIEAVLAVAHRALWECIEAAGKADERTRDYLDDVVEYSRLRRTRPLDATLQFEGTFRYAFDEIQARSYVVDPGSFRLNRPGKMRFWHDEQQVGAIRALCESTDVPALRARDFVYPRLDPGSNPYIRRSAFC